MLNYFAHHAWARSTVYIKRIDNTLSLHNSKNFHKKMQARRLLSGCMLILLYIIQTVTGKQGNV